MPDSAEFEDPKTIRLTSLSSCAGCASKLSQTALAKVLHGLPQFQDSRLIVGNATSDDAGVFAIDEKRALVQTVDFFTPIVDDPYTYGQIAATNALSDVYAMGGCPLTALAIAGMPDEILSPEVIREILRGGADKAKQAQCSLLGGHTIKVPEPVYGLACTGLVQRDRLMSNAGAVPGDILVMTKPLGTGVLTTAIKRGLVSGSIVDKGIELMTTLNVVGTGLAENGWCCAATDVTGFGLLGHLKSLCLASGVGAELKASSVPVLDGGIVDLIEEHDCVPGGSRANFEASLPFVDWADTVALSARFLLADAQTSGGLLCAIPERHLEKALNFLTESGTMVQAVVGRIVEAPTEENRLISVS
ncbi:selenide, water dikinase SelD [Puniceicoccaceae bacterium K14]|nr:selenide, water dikinase SelD [Puniceicoccaceae bacterium K14]